MIWHRNITLAEGRNSLAGEQNDIMLWDSRLICLRDRNNADDVKNFRTASGEVQ
jgi:hypothetical protein